MQPPHKSETWICNTVAFFALQLSLQLKVIRHFSPLKLDMESSPNFTTLDTKEVHDQLYHSVLFYERYINAILKESLLLMCFLFQLRVQH